MTTPRPPGVRRALVKKANRTAPNRPVRARRFLSLGSSGFASLAFAHSAQPHCPRQRTRIYPSRGLALSARATSQTGDR